MAQSQTKNITELPYHLSTLSPMELPNQKSFLSNLPVEVLLDNVLPFSAAPDLFRLAQCSKLFAELCADETLWKRKVSEDYNFFGQGTARTNGWKLIYKGLFKPRVFVWGEKSNGRLGLSQIPKSIIQGVPYPVQVRLPGVRVVNIVAGGMSFHALDSEGNVYVWGTLQGVSGAYAAESQGFSAPDKPARTPLKLNLPVPIRSISCGRLHSALLDGSNKVWTLTNWGRPFRLSSPILADPDYKPKQVECGWGFSSMLTHSGDVFVWWPLDGVMGRTVQQKMRDMDSEGNMRAFPTQEGIIPCIPWDLDMLPTRLPAMPSLPDISNADNTSKFQNIELIQIAAFDQHIIGLTNYGHVLKYGGLHSETDAANGQWEYLPLFSEVERVREHPAFTSTDNSMKLDAPHTMTITHISANFLHFVAYSTDSSSIVLIGDTNTTPTSEPKIIPQLQNKSVISVVLGDYHNAALTANGKLLTWGAYSNGALGLGDPLKLKPGIPGAYSNGRELTAARSGGRPRVNPVGAEIPTEVRFDHGSKKQRERFCFATTAAGWHTGALVIDLQADDGEAEEKTEDMQSSDSDDRSSPRSRWQTPPIMPLPGILRRGYPGPGRTGGFTDGLGWNPQPPTS